MYTGQKFDPLDNPKDDVWYSHQPLGKNKLGIMMKSVATIAEITGRKVNHSTRKTFASTLLQHSSLITTFCTSTSFSSSL
jgi:hypothetical protein